MRVELASLLAGVALWLAAPAAGAEVAPSPDAEMARLARDIVAAQLIDDPTLPLFVDVEGGHNDVLADISPAALVRKAARDDALLARLLRIDPKTLTDRGLRRDHAIAREMLEADKGLRVCHNERWTVSHMFGWPINLPVVAERQPVATAKDRADALARWSAFPDYIAADLANLRTGIATGYTSPRSVAQRVLPLIEGMITAAPEDSPFYAPAKRSDDPAFKAAFARLVAERITPAVRTYRDFLKDTYIPAARESLSVLDLPDGRACYNAWLRYYTTLDRPGEAVAALGEKTVAANVETVRALGRQLYGVDDFGQILARVKNDPAERFASKAEIVAFSQALVARGQAASAALVDHVPSQPLEVRPMSEAMEASGGSSFFMPNSDPTKPALYMLQVGRVEDARRADMAITAVHEGYPGHHLQIAYAAGLRTTPLSRIAFNSAYVEGWARYAERMAEEVGLLNTPQAKIARRAWPARGMVADPGLHLGRWSRERIIAYLNESGRFPPQQLPGVVDRIAIMPGQLTAYDSGGLEIMALRAEAEAALGPRFDLRAFNAAVLSDGVVPLALLRENVEAWIASQKAR